MYMQIYLNIFIPRPLTDLQQKSVGRHTHNSLFSNKSSAHYKDNCFLMVNVYILLSNNFLSASHVFLLNQVILFISSVIWVFFNEFPEYNIPNEELGYGPNYSIIYFIVYIYQVRCATHGIITNGPIVCIACE